MKSTACSLVLTVQEFGTIALQYSDLQCTLLQGMLGRPDWQAAARVPIALLPAGSGNALSANTGMWDLPTALHAVIKAGVNTHHRRQHSDTTTCGLLRMNLAFLRQDN